MKKILAAALAIVMLLCCLSLPCMADSSAGVYLKVTYKTDTKMIKLSGTMAVSRAKDWATIYLLNPGFTRDDIPNHSKDNPVFSYCNEITANDDGTFEYEFKHSGDPGIYTLYFTTGYAHITRILDTRNDIEIENGQLEALRGLPKSYAAPTYPDASVKQLFLEKKDELPDEMPVVSPRKIESLLKEVFVDVNNGDDDTADGSINSPYKTINAALKENPPEAGMTLYLREGTYTTDDALDISNVLATDELPFVISNYNNETVAVVGGIDIKGSDFEEVSDTEILQRLNPAISGNIKVVDIKEKYGVTDFSNESQKLIVNGNNYTVARWPNSGTTTMREYTGEGAENGVIDSGMVTHTASPLEQYPRTYSKRATERNTAAGEVVDTDTGFEVCIEDIRPFSWVNTGDIKVTGSFYAEWTSGTYLVSEFNPETRSIRTATGINYGARHLDDNTFYYHNILEELDSPGEYFIDKNEGKLYIYPLGDITDAQITYEHKGISQMWKLTACKSVIINGINFKDSNATAILVANDKTDGVVVQNCSFENVRMGVKMYGTYSGVINCKFKDLLGNGIQLLWHDEYKPNLIPDRKFAQNNTFYNTYGLRLYGVGQIASHNYLSNTINSCIYVDGAECIVEYNEIVAGPRNVEDSGAIYVDGGNMWDRGNHIRYNYIHDMDSTPRAIYFDDMISECFAYGNIIDGSCMFIHTGSDNAVYNNIFLNYGTYGSLSSSEGPVLVGDRYFWKAYYGSNEWKNASLEYGLMTANLKNKNYGSDPVNKTITGVWAERYPRLKTWAELMYRRIEEYENNGKTVDSAKTSSIYDYTGKYTRTVRVQKEIFGYKYWTNVSDPVQLNSYLAAARDNYLGNNLFINTSKLFADLPNDDGRYYSYFRGILRSVAENNVYLTSDQNPFTNNDYSDAAAYSAIYQYNTAFKPIPFEKIGPAKEDYPSNGKVTSNKPPDTTLVSISGSDLLLEWSSVEGAQKYTVEIATDDSFAEASIVDRSDAIYDLSYKVDANLESDTVYYWRVKAEDTHKYATGTIEISDTFKFKTLVEGMQTERNSVGVTVYSVDDMTKDNFKVTTYAYNTLNEAKDATIYIACYDKDNRLISAKSKTVNIAANTLTEKYEFDFKAPDTKKIKLFVWSADGTMIPYTFVKTIK